MPVGEVAGTVRKVSVPEAYRLDVSAGPVAWAAGRSSRHAWVDDALIWCGREGERVVWRQVRQPEPGQLAIAGTANAASDASWVATTLHPVSIVTAWDDPALDRLAAEFPGL